MTGTRIGIYYLLYDKIYKVPKIYTSFFMLERC